MARGKTLEEAMKITNADVAEALGGLPPNKLHCSNLGADALHSAIKNYQDRKAVRWRARPTKSRISGKKTREDAIAPTAKRRWTKNPPSACPAGKNCAHEHDH